MTTTGSYTSGLLLLSGLGIIATGVVLGLHHDGARERAPEVPATR